MLAGRARLNQGIALTAVSEAALSAGSEQGLSTKLRPGPGREPTEVADHQRARIHGAVIEIVDDGGYGAITVRALTRAARVSTKTFYQHYSGKEECLLRSFELVAHRMLSRLASAQFDELGCSARTQATVRAFTSELESDPRAARLLLIDAYSGGPSVLAQVREMERVFVTIIGECFAGTWEGVDPSPLIVEGIVAGLMSVARARLIVDRAEDLSDLGRPLSNWALSLCSRAAAQLTETNSLYHPAERSPSRPHSVPSSDAKPKQGERAPTGDLALLLSAATKLVADEHEDLSAQRIAATAGVSRRSFYTHFRQEEECLNAALELQIDEALARAKRSKTSSATWAGGVSGAMATLCAEVDSNPVLASIYSDRVVGASDMGRLQCHERFTSEISRLLGEGAPYANRPDPLMFEASAGAILGTLRRPKELDRNPSRLAGTVAFLALAPIIGADRAVNAIREEQAPAARTG